jgi:hypothetical membrane protein
VRTFWNTVSAKEGLAAVLWILAAAGYLSVEALAAMALPGYGYGTDYISTLGDPIVSPRASLMNAAFAFQGLCFGSGAMLVASRVPNARNRLWFLAFAISNGIGNVLVALVHSGQGNAWHVAGAALAIVGGNGAALAGSALFASRAYRAASIVLGGLGLLCLLVVAMGADHIGAWERGSVYPIFAWQVLAAVYVLRRQFGAGSGSSMS